MHSSLRPLDELPTDYAEFAKSLGLNDGLILDDGWSTKVDLLKLVAAYVQSEKPQLIVECGSGLSTLVLARCCQLNKTGRVVALENGYAFAEETKEACLKYGLKEYSKVVVAPLEELELSGESYEWYGLARMPETAQIDMLFIDGPPDFFHEQSRYPALPRLYQCLSDNAVIFLDGTARQKEKETVERWLRAYPDFSHEYVANQRGCSILRRVSQ